jgi:hypothetical protein
LLHTFHLFQHAQDDGGRKQVLVRDHLRMVQHGYEVFEALLMIPVACKRVDYHADMTEVSGSQGKNGVKQNGAVSCALRHNGLERPARVTWV